MRRAYHLSRGVLPTLVRRCMWFGNLKNEEAMARIGPQRHRWRGESVTLVQIVCWFYEVKLLPKCERRNKKEECKEKEREYFVQHLKYVSIYADFGRQKIPNTSIPYSGFFGDVLKNTVRRGHIRQTVFLIGMSLLVLFRGDLPFKYECRTFRLWSGCTWRNKTSIDLFASIRGTQELPAVMVTRFKPWFH